MQTPLMCELKSVPKTLSSETVCKVFENTRSSFVVSQSNKVHITESPAYCVEPDPLSVINMILIGSLFIQKLEITDTRMALEPVK